MAVGTYQGVAGLAPRLFTLEEETGSHHGHGHVHRTRMLICMHNWGSSLHLPPHRRSSIIVMRMHSRSSSRYCCRRRLPRRRMLRALTSQDMTYQGIGPRETATFEAETAQGAVANPQTPQWARHSGNTHNTLASGSHRRTHPSLGGPHRTHVHRSNHAARRLAAR